ncbi:unnamed protein product [Rotaria sordida]|uniref:Uncharacterized protein n=1 Tax=Rotaria sordida TaxID=392033 RepID=A0A814Q281_9BILA|nr:unnamed protein product [Rotaria sordida]CAF1384129.1 unnamed protein product [Rotaria sordida]
MDTRLERITDSLNWIMKAMARVKMTKEDPPLIEHTKKVSNNMKQTCYFYSFSDWGRCFGNKEANDQYRKLDDDTEDSDNKASIGVFDLIIAHEAMKELNTYSKAGRIVQEVFSSLRTVLSLNGSKFEQKRYERELHLTRWSSVRQGAIFGVFMGWLSLLTYIVYAVGLIFGSILMSYENHNTLSISDILVIVCIFSQCMYYVSFIGSFFQSFSEARGAATQVFQLIDEAQMAGINETEIWKKSRSNEDSVDINGDIEFDNVNFIYPSRKGVSVLNNLNFIARAGQTTALVGLSGCGKSTCISLLLRYYEPSSGRLIINGRLSTDYDLKQLRQNIGVVSQEPILFDMSVYENIRFGKVNATQAEIEEAAEQANAHNFIMQLPNKYETCVGERGIQLSGGEKQRIALARALVKQPTLLLLDEATSALDNASEKIVQEALDRACQGRTTIVIAHRLTTIENVHHIYVLDSGGVIEQGTHEILMAQEGGKYKEMIKNQQIKKINNSKVDIMSMAKPDEEDEKQIFERSLLSDSQAADVDRTFKDCVHSERHRQVLTSSFLFLLLGLIILILRFLQFLAFAISGSKLTQRIRSKAFACLLRQEVAYFDRSENNSGALCVHLSTDASAIQQMIGTRLGVICENLALTCVGLLLGILFSWQLTIIIFVPCLILIIALFLSVRLQMCSNEQTSLIHRQANKLAIEVIHNMRTIKQLSVEKEVLQKYSEFIHDISIIFQKYSLLRVIPLSLFWGSDAYISAFLYWRALVLVEQNKINLNSIVTILAFAIFAFQILKSIDNMSAQIGTSLSAAKSFFDLFDRTPAIDNTSTEGQELVDFHGAIEFNQVKFSYPTRPTTIVLNKFQLNIKPGQCVALVGASGSGKSTIIQLLERFYDVGHGQLLLDGVDIRQLNIRWVRSCFGLNVPMEDIINAAKKANIHDFIKRLPQGYETKVGMKGSFLSGGEKQRIAIARALLRQPKVLLLDEATSAMDSHNEQMVHQALEAAQIEDPSRTLLIIAQRLSTIRSCDLICVIDKGHIVESGTHTELMQRCGAYYMLFTQNNT